MRHLVLVILKQMGSLTLQKVCRDICKMKCLGYKHVVNLDKTFG